MCANMYVNVLFRQQQKQKNKTTTNKNEVQYLHVDYVYL